MSSWVQLFSNPPFGNGRLDKEYKKAC